MSTTDEALRFLSGLRAPEQVWQWCDWRCWYYGWSGGDTMTLERQMMMDGDLRVETKLVIRRQGLFSYSISSTDLPPPLVVALVKAYSDAMGDE